MKLEACDETGVSQSLESALSGRGGTTVVEAAMDLTAQDMPHGGDQSQDLDIQGLGLQSAHGCSWLGPAHAVCSIHAHELAIALRWRLALDVCVSGRGRPRVDLRSIGLVVLLSALPMRLGEILSEEPAALSLSGSVKGQAPLVRAQRNRMRDERHLAPLGGDPTHDRAVPWQAQADVGMP